MGRKRVVNDSKTVSIRGTPPDSYSKTDFWTNHVNLGLFIVNNQLYKHYKGMGFIECATTIKKLLIKWPLRKYNNEIVNYLGNDWTVRWFMVLGVVKSSNVFKVITVGVVSMLTPKSLLKKILRKILPQFIINFLKEKTRKF
jgi:hypothetical protein